jgi:hypothetical protein
MGHLPRGRFLHDRIAAAEPVPGERPLGWLAHYAIGITFALFLLAICGLEWVQSPTILQRCSSGSGPSSLPGS